jgi:hypothetical protein
MCGGERNDKKIKLMWNCRFANLHNYMVPKNMAVFSNIPMLAARHSAHRQSSYSTKTEGFTDAMDLGTRAAAEHMEISPAT